MLALSREAPLPLNRYFPTRDKPTNCTVLQPYFLRKALPTLRPACTCTFTVILRHCPLLPRARYCLIFPFPFPVRVVRCLL